MISLQIQTHLWQDYGFTKARALHDLVQARLSSNAAYGKGNKAAKRAAHIETAQWFDTYAQLSDMDINAMYDELRTEGRVR